MADLFVRRVRRQCPSLQFLCLCLVPGVPFDVVAPHVSGRTGGPEGGRRNSLGALEDPVSAWVQSHSQWFRRDSFVPSAWRRSVERFARLVRNRCLNSVGDRVGGSWQSAVRTAARSFGLFAELPSEAERDLKSPSVRPTRGEGSSMGAPQLFLLQEHLLAFSVDVLREPYSSGFASELQRQSDTAGDFRLRWTETERAGVLFADKRTEMTHQELRFDLMMMT
uniref:Uncharacterized protein n=1 Tax=Chromera velia CCMP2878 TaxID=1169474 RepID=A0A0G4HSH3_9ALVE|eukprot:Cvel_31007.t1-p1 / transcript=Cvel_31007.t1 / gene=Cvel_31007 / organism=Chromera_velia_CCMP2878 / gene_product=hypothetical protein / transcript_product=hypothetical protein / location=Cvel_scaffold4536:8204-9093(-) / protein_length=222 / sequence_SO=supercontig / SO=protein_coding / is_pseudo=false